jgi:murein DD-endopeptidase MepM/ murein hydrolase activator NlpD
MPFYLSLLSLFLILRCATFSPSHRHGGYSVEEVIRRSEGVKVETEEFKDLARKPTSKNQANQMDQQLPLLQWPLKWIAINSKFGSRSRNNHQGLDLKAPEGTPIYAAGKGVAVFAGDEIDGYGNTIILKHSQKYWTLYAHAMQLLIEKGDLVQRGQCIAYSGETGRTTGPHLHFEVRRGVEAVNPAKWIERNRVHTFLPQPVEE